MNLKNKIPQTYCSRSLSLILGLSLLVAGCQQESPEVPEEKPAPAETATEAPAKTIPEVPEELETFVNAEEKPPILVTGATGRQGGALVEELLARGFYIRGLTRDLSQPKAKALLESGIEMVAGDFGKPDTLEAAMQDMYGVFLNTPNVPEQVTFGENVVNAAKAAGVRYIVYSSNLSAHPDYVRSDMPKAIVEQTVRESGIDYTILRPATFMENYAGLQSKIAEEGVRDPRKPDTRQQFISVKDIAFFAAEAFEKPILWTGSEENIASDELTNQELADLFSRVMGILVSFEQVPWEEWSKSVPPRLIELQRWSEESDFRVDIETLREENPNLMTFERYLRETGWENWTP